MHFSVFEEYSTKQRNSVGFQTDFVLTIFVHFQLIKHIVHISHDGCFSSYDEGHQNTPGSALQGQRHVGWSQGSNVLLADGREDSGVEALRTNDRTLFSLAALRITSRTPE